MKHSGLLAKTKTVRFAPDLFGDEGGRREEPPPPPLDGENNVSDPRSGKNRPDKDKNGNGDEHEQKPPHWTTGRKKLILGAVGAAIVIGGAYYLYQKSKLGEGEAEAAGPSKLKGALRRRVRFADQVEEGDAEDEARAEAAQLAAYINEVQTQIQKSYKELTDLTSEEAQNRATLDGMLGDDKASFDQDQAAFETEQNFSTAFMMKTDMDKRKSDIQRLDKEIGLTKDMLKQRINDLSARLQEASERYKVLVGARGPVAR